MREVGKSKATLVAQQTQLFTRAVLFAVLNPQENGACFAGMRAELGRKDVSQYVHCSCIRAFVRCIPMRSFSCICLLTGKVVKIGLSSFIVVASAPSDAAYCCVVRTHALASSSSRAHVCTLHFPVLSEPWSHLLTVKRFDGVEIRCKGTGLTNWKVHADMPAIRIFFFG